VVVAAALELVVPVVGDADGDGDGEAVGAGVAEGLADGLAETAGDADGFGVELGADDAAMTAVAPNAIAATAARPASLRMVVPLSVRASTRVRGDAASLVAAR
jgi:hypothetical protein